MAFLNHEGNRPLVQMLTLGVTGGMGGGKSTVCDILEGRGARIFDADDVGKEILQADAGARREIIDAFGPESYDEQGRLNRSFLSSVVFSDPERLTVINSIVHPRVFEKFEVFRLRARAAAAALVVHEAALLFESGGDRLVDRTVYVDAPRWLRIRRVMERDGRTRREILVRMRHQLPAYRGRKRADFVIRNEGSLKQLQRRVDRLLQRLQEQTGLPLGQVR